MMPLDDNAAIELTAFAWVPPFAQGYVRDLRIRWALEEVAAPYRVRLLDVRSKPAEYLAEQPFGQVPAYRDEEVQLFESGAILIHLGLRHSELLPAAHAERMRTIAWLIAGLNSIEPQVGELGSVDVFHKDEAWTGERRPQVVDSLRRRFGQLQSALGGAEWLTAGFSIADIVMVSVLRETRECGLLDEFPELSAYVARAEARPAFKQALSDQLAAFRAHEPQFQGEAA
jgi:glutathione S-transferase